MRRILFSLSALVLIVFLLSSFVLRAQNWEEKPGIAVIAYYSGNSKAIDNYPVKKLTHIIYSFCHLKGNRLNVDNADDSATITKLVSLKAINPKLKVLLSLGGWGGCEYCSPVFATEAGRDEFTKSVKEVNDYFKTDGIDLDWEYPSIEGYPGHKYQSLDRDNFTALVKVIRNAIGDQHEISFAAGGFNEFLKRSIDWKEVMPVVNFVNLMSYDLVNGFSTTTGHHTPLYSTALQMESTDNAVRYLTSLGVPAEKIVIGSAFYGRTWEKVPDINNGLNQPGKFKSFIPYRQFDQRVSTDSGFVFYRDTTARAPCAYNATKKIFATFDDKLSIRNKTQYVKDKGLHGIMFWELTLDNYSDGLLDVIDKVKNEK
ncbi:MAG: glycoside hydrolase family 18 protein [Chitinophagaceae bacterium]